jgi:cytosine/adenosine deaminase-related metal-dependent hydrolase
MLVDGAIFDRAGPRAAMVRLRSGRVVDVGQHGTLRPRGDEQRVRGIVIPSPVNAHTHLGDAVSVREPPAGPVEELVASPHGYKFRVLAAASQVEKRRAIRAALDRMARDGVYAVVDFREEGLDGVRLLRSAAAGARVRVLALGRPLARPIQPAELTNLLREADGVGLSSARDETRSTREAVARACHQAGRRFALHASEAVREDPSTFLDPRPDLLIHLAKASEDDLAEVARARVRVAVCPRSNALFARQPNLAGMERAGVRLLLGTDNAMFHAPSIWRELEFAYVATRLKGRPASATYLARAALVEPYAWLGEPKAAEVEVGSPVHPLIVRLPPDDPAYQLVTRTTEHLILRPGASGPGTRSR